MRPVTHVVREEVGDNNPLGAVPKDPEPGSLGEAKRRKLSVGESSDSRVPESDGGEGASSSSRLFEPGDPADAAPAASTSSAAAPPPPGVVPTLALDDDDPAYEDAGVHPNGERITRLLQQGVHKIDHKSGVRVCGFDEEEATAVLLIIEAAMRDSQQRSHMQQFLLECQRGGLVLILAKHVEPQGGEPWGCKVKRFSTGVGGEGLLCACQTVHRTDQWQALLEALRDDRLDMEAEEGGCDHESMSVAVDDEMPELNNPFDSHQTAASLLGSPLLGDPPFSRAAYEMVGLGEPEPLGAIVAPNVFQEYEPLGVGKPLFDSDTPVFRWGGMWR